MRADNIITSVSTTNHNTENMADDFDIEYLLEAPYKKEEIKQESVNVTSTNGNNGDVKAHNGNSNSEIGSDDDKSKSKSKSSKKKKERSRSRDRKRDHKDKKRSKSKERKRSRDRKRSRSRSRKHSRDRSRHRSRSKPRIRQKSPELNPEERDQRTVFCMQLAARIRPRDLEDFFSAVGKVRDVRLITDPRTKKSKGIAYIEFKNLEAVQLAIGLSGQRLLGVPIIVKPSFAEKNRQALPTATTPAAALPQAGPMKLYVGSLHVNITEEMLRGIFEPFGKIDATNLVKDEFGRSKGYGFVQFSSADDAKRAMEQLNGFELAGRPIKVSHVTEKITDSGAQSNLDSDDLDRTGVNLGASGKLALMAKLAEGSGIVLPQYTLDALNMATAAAAAASQAIFSQQSTPANNGGTNNPIMSISTQCLMIANMFDMKEEMKKPNWVSELTDDIIEECNKHGGITHAHIDEEANSVYVKCPSISCAISVTAALNGRYFGGRVINTTFIPITNYHQLFPDSIYAQQLLQPNR